MPLPLGQRVGPGACGCTPLRTAKPVRPAPRLCPATHGGRRKREDAENPFLSGGRGGCIYLGRSLWGEDPLWPEGTPPGWRLPLPGAAGWADGQGTGGDAVPAQAVTGARGGRLRAASGAPAQAKQRCSCSSQTSRGQRRRRGWSCRGKAWEAHRKWRRARGWSCDEATSRQTCTHTSLRQTGCSFHR